MIAVRHAATKFIPHIRGTIRRTSMAAPAEFRKLCQRFIQDIFLVTSSEEERAKFLINGLTADERRRLKPFLDNVIARYSAEQLVRLWHETPAEFYMPEGEEVRSFLKTIRDEIEQG